MGIIRYLSSSPAGDLISFMAGIRQMWITTGSKGLVYQQLDVVGIGIQGYDQPFKNERGESILLGMEMFDNLKPLIEAQEYIESFEVYNGQEVDFDFNKIRNEIFVNQPLGSLNRYPFYAFPQMNCDLSESYIHVKPFDFDAFSDDKVIVNFTSRYRNNFINYFFLKKYEDKIIFIGLDNEYKFFCNQWGLKIGRLTGCDFYEIAQAISTCKFFLGNASVCYQIAEALKVPRILEICQLIPNVIPVGKYAYDFYHQSAVEYYFNKLINK